MVVMTDWAKVGHFGHCGHCEHSGLAGDVGERGQLRNLHTSIAKELLYYLSLQY